jgi:hypothetical protein
MAAREPQGEGDTVAANGVGCYSFSLHHHEHTDSCVATVGLTDGRERIHVLPPPDPQPIPGRRQLLAWPQAAQRSTNDPSASRSQDVDDTRHRLAELSPTMCALASG